ncbi:MAG: hypothetical protein ACE5GH_05370, partial [Fidelibacterota bacterium]
MKENDVIALLELMRVPGLGPVRLRTLVSAFQRPSHIFKASVGELCGPGRIDMGLAQRILKREPTSFPEEQMKKAGKLGVQIITFWDKP